MSFEFLIRSPTSFRKVHIHAGGPRVPELRIRLVVQVSAVAAVDAEGLTVYTDGERGTPHGHERADVGRDDDVREHRVLFDAARSTRRRGTGLDAPAIIGASRWRGKPASIDHCASA